MGYCNYVCSHHAHFGSARIAGLRHLKYYFRCIASLLIGGIELVVLTFICLTLVTQVAHNIGIMIAVLPTLAGVCVSLGISPVLYVFLLSILLQAAFVTPGASAQAALVFGQTAWLSSKSAMFYGTVYAILTLLVVLILAFPIGLVLF